MFRWFGNPCTPKVRRAMQRRPDLCSIQTPMQGNRVPDDTEACADNSCFGDKFPGYGRWISWLEKMSGEADRFRFVVAPDVFLPDRGRGDAAATLKRSLPWLPAIRALGFPAAFVSQEGSDQPGLIPWDDIDCLFIGGADAWKWGPEVRDLIVRAKELGKWVHIGRVNSWEHVLASVNRGADSADGTFLVFGPDINLPIVLSWLDKANWQIPLWGAA